MNTPHSSHLLPTHLECFHRGCHSAHHRGPAVAPQGVLQDTRELRVSVRDVCAFTPWVRQCRNHIPCNWCRSSGDCQRGVKLKW
eukprot:1161622-Pelagomonas_calceolata.AAC.10